MFKLQKDEPLHSPVSTQHKIVDTDEDEDDE